MNDNKLSTNLSTIDTAVSRMRTSLNASNLDINKLADKVAEVKASLDGLESNMVYEVSSREGMLALTGIADGSACLIKATETRGIKKWDKFVTINFPDRVVLNTPLEQDEVINIGIKIKGTGHGTLTGSLSATSFIFGVIIKGQGASAKSITYTAQGNTYVRTDSYSSPVISAGELQWDDSYTFDDRLSQFFVADILLEETNIYYKNSWVPVNAGETLELKTTTAEQAATIMEQTATNSRLNTELTEANATIQQQELTIATQENTITLKDAEIASLNARIEELESSLTPSVYNIDICFNDSETGEMLDTDYNTSVSVGDNNSNLIGTYTGNGSGILFTLSEPGSYQLIFNEITTDNADLPAYNKPENMTIEVMEENTIVNVTCVQVEDGEQEDEEEYANLSVGIRTEDGSNLPEDVSYSISVQSEMENYEVGPDFVSSDSAFSDLPAEFIPNKIYTVTLNELDERYEIVGDNPMDVTVTLYSGERPFTVRLKEQTDTRVLLTNGETLSAGTRLILPVVENHEHTCNEINDLDLNTQLVYMNDGNAVLCVKNIENIGMTMVEIGPSSSDDMLTYMSNGESSSIDDLKVYTFDSGSLINYDDEIGEIEIIVNRESEVYFSEFYQTYLQDILPVYKIQ